VTRIVLADPAHQVPAYDRALAGALAAAGCEVTLAIAPAIHYHAGPLPPGVNEQFAFGRLVAVLRHRAPAVLKSVRTRRMLRLASYPAELAAFGRGVTVDRPAVLHLQWGLLPAVEARAWLRVRRAGVPVVYTAHNVLPHEPRPGQPAAWRALYRSVDQIIVHSAAARARLLVLFGLPAARVHVVPMAADRVSEPLDRAAARQRLGLPPTTPLVLFFGHVRPYKGLDLLLDALPALTRSVPGVRLLVAGPVAGGAHGASQLRADIAARGLRPLVALNSGYVAPEQVNDLFAAADVVALPYRATDDSAVLQAARGRGRAVVATAVGGLPEALAAGGGLLVPPHDPSALAAALARVLAEPGLRPALEAAARSACEARTWADVAQETLAVYRAAGARIPARAPAVHPQLP
jgi:glycosyltransferase involved in cell wall biosynthesis